MYRSWSLIKLWIRMLRGGFVGNNVAACPVTWPLLSLATDPNADWGFQITRCPEGESLPWIQAVSPGLKPWSFWLFGCHNSIRLLVLQDECKSKNINAIMSSDTATHLTTIFHMTPHLGSITVYWCALFLKGHLINGIWQVSLNWRTCW